MRTVEDALKIKIPDNANIIRNLMHSTLFAQDHLVHFYHLHALDWVDIVSALKADPKKTSEIQQSISNWPNSSPGYFREVQNRLKKFVESGQLGIFANAYWGHPAYKLPPEVNLLATTHYLEALDFQKEIVKIQTIFGGKNPHPNWLVGGVPSALNVDNTGAVGAVNMKSLSIPVRVTGPGSHSEEEPLQYLDIPRDVGIFEMPRVPRVDDADALAIARDTLAKLLELMQCWQPGDPHPIVDMEAVTSSARSCTAECLPGVRAATRTLEPHRRGERNCGSDRRDSATPANRRDRGDQGGWRLSARMRCAQPGGRRSPSLAQGPRRKAVRGHAG